MNSFPGGASAGAPVVTMTEAKKFYEQGLRAEQIGRFQDALKYYRAAARQDPTFRAAFNNLGALYARARRPDLAIGFFKRALQLGEDDVVLFNLGSESYRLEEFTESEAYLKKALKHNPRLLKAHLLLAYLNEKFNRPEKAEIYFQNALKIEPANRVAALGLAVSLASREEFEASLEIVNRFLERVPADAGLKNLRAGLLLKLNRFQDSLNDLTEVTKTSARFTSFTDHLQEARRETGAEYDRVFEGLGEKISDRTRRLKARLEKRKELLAKKKQAGAQAQGATDPELEKDLQEMVDLSFLHLFNGDPEKAMRYLVQARKIKSLSE